ncbi:histidine kinase [Actinosynnema sp. NPDC020468]|uniref:sensor histidine kinase n=1 Tax=Actinosynnema sp. NPDC020468 TaxID=3154488 RepID=UPI003405FB1F
MPAELQVDDRAQWRLIGVAGLGVTIVMVLLDRHSLGRELAAVGVLLLIALLRLSRPKFFLVGSFVLFAVAVWLSFQSTYVLFAVLPQVYRDLPLRRAFPVMVAFAFVPWVIGYVQTGDPLAMLLTSLLVIVFSQLFAWALTAIVDRNEEIARLSREAGVAAERERLSAEIHDTLAQGFTSIVTLVQAAQADPAAADRHLELALRTARENLAEARSLVAALAPAALDGTLADALERLVARLEEDGITGSFSVTGAAPLPTSVEVVLLRAAQEALTNARRHSGASLVVVDLEFGAAAVRLTVHDDGVGVGTSAEGFGLRGMRARVEQVGGTVSVSDSDGAVVVVEVPR